MHFFCVYGQKPINFHRYHLQNVAWRPYCTFRFSGSNFILVSNIKSKHQWHIICLYRREPVDFQQSKFQNGCLAAILDFAIFGLWRWHGFLGVTQVCFGVSFSNFTCMLFVFVSMGRSLCIVSDIAFKMAAWQPYWIFGFPDSNFSLASNTKTEWHIICVYRKEPIDFQRCHFQNGCLASILYFHVSGLYRSHGFCSVTWVSISNLTLMLLLAMGRSLLIYRDVTFKMAAWWPYWILAVSEF